MTKLLEIQIATTADDGYIDDSSGGDFVNANNWIQAGHRGADPAPTDEVHSFMRFTGMNIPQGAAIRRAYLVLVCYSTIAFEVVNTNIYANDVADSVAPTNYAEFNALAKTTAFVAWDAIPAWVAETTYYSPDISPVIQEVVDLPLWAGDAITILWLDDGSTDDDTNSVVRAPYDYTGSAAKSAKLHVEWSEPGHIWIEDAEFHYTDEDWVERVLRETSTIVCYEDTVVCNNDKVVYS